MKLITTLSLMLACLSIQAQSAAIRGQIQDTDGFPAAYANVILYHSTDSSLYKAEATDEAGLFKFAAIAPGSYFLKATYVGAPDLWIRDIQLAKGQLLDLAQLSFSSSTIDLKEATITASRVMVEVKPDRTIFNVDGTINSVGADAISLLRQAPGVTVDNNDNINVLGRSGVLLYVDGKRLPLTGQDLTNYLQNLPAEQIDRIEIITNPGARYEAEGNAGIIDIRLKKDKSLGANGTASATYSQGRYDRSNINASGNYRNKIFNTFATAGLADGSNYHNMDFLNFQNGLLLDEINNSRNHWQNYNYRIGTDFFLSDQHTLGLLVGGMQMNGDRWSLNRIAISGQATPAQVDSILVAFNTADDRRKNNTFNLNYQFDNKKGRSLNVDLDYGRYENDSRRLQPNRYYDATETELLTEIINSFDTPTDIDIYTFNADYEEEVWGGKLGIGSKLSRVVSDNTFLFFDVISGNPERNNQRSNLFKYEENVYAGYINYAHPLGKKWNFSAGLRAEQTDAKGDLRAFLPELQEPPVKLDYLNWFPSAGLTWQVSPKHNLALNYGRRINRPDYNVLNPFNNQVSQLSYEKGNPFLRPEIVNNLELSYTLSYRYNFKLAYSRTTDQITRLLAPDDEDPRAGFITWANLAEQNILSFNASAPAQVVKGWDAYFNLSASYLDNQADLGEGAVVDLQAFTYSIYQQHTISLPAGFKGEISGYYSGPGVWGGVFEYESSWSLNLGLQRKFMQDRLNLRLSANDVFYQTGWDGQSTFDGLTAIGSGRWDSRRASLSVSYSFGNEKVQSRKRKTGLEEEAGRVGGE
ncbi:MAG: TonB-dependent receptor [Lewinellaceae bacterium]|nr:TonB-dependent receptor [Phaeodactylibacter sp.]MCB9035680.1 TonB-dependent receptor [Lewinellaceae bacterium]